MMHKWRSYKIQHEGIAAYVSCCEDGIVELIIYVLTNPSTLFRGEITRTEAAAYLKQWRSKKYEIEYLDSEKVRVRIMTMPDGVPRTHKEMWLEEAIRVNMASFIKKFSSYGYTEEEIARGLIHYLRTHVLGESEGEPQASENDLHTE